MTAPIGVLVMAYGTANGPDDIERYYTDIRGGRAPSPEHLQDLRERYAAIGNVFPLLDTTRAQAEGLVERLNARAADGAAFRAYLGMKHSPPLIPEGVEAMRADGIARGVGIVMAPHWSGMSVETYVERVLQATDDGGGPAFSFVRSYHDHPAFVAFLADRVAEALERLQPSERERALVIFSAHSLPVRTVADGSLRCKSCDCDDSCRYRDGLQRTADLVAERLGLPHHAIGWQSAGRTADPWWGPPVEDVIVEAAGAGHPAVVVCSAGFVADHLEVLYDLDIEARAIAEGAGLRFYRTRMPNADPAYLDVLGAVVGDHLAEDREALASPMTRFAIVGGGIAGLTVAYRLRQRGLDPVVLEAGDRPGGKLRSIDVGGLRVEAGADAFVARKPWAVDLCRELGVPTIAPGASGSYLWTAQGLRPFPKDAPFGIPGDLAQVLRWPGLSGRGRRRAAADLLIRTRKDGEEETLGALLRRRLGDEATDRAVAPLLAGLYAGDVDRLSARATFPELLAWEESQGSLIRGSAAASRASERASAGPMFRKPERGMERLTTALVDALGDRVRTDAPVASLDDLEPWDALVLATPAFESGRLLGDRAPGIAAELAAIPYVSTGVVVLVYPPGSQATLPDGTGFVASRGMSPMTACTWLSSKWPDDAWGDRAVLRCYVGAATEEDVLDAEDADLIDACARHLAAVLPVPERPEAAAVHRWPRALPQFERGHLERVARIREGLPAGIFVAGNAYDGVGIPDTVRGAGETAEAVAAFLATRRTDQETVQ